MSELAMTLYAMLAAIIVVGPVWLFAALFSEQLRDMLGGRVFASLVLAAIMMIAIGVVGVAVN